MSIIYKTKTASQDDIFLHLLDNDENFYPPLSERLDVKEFAEKIHDLAITFEAWDGNSLIGIVSVYCNRPVFAFINHVCVSRIYKGNGIASKLISQCIEFARANGLEGVNLEVNPKNKAAISLYEKIGFKKTSNGTGVESMMMRYSMRNYDKEIKDTSDHKYAYHFDFDVIHPLMFRSFEPFFKDGNALELGSFRGDFTTRLLNRFNDITCVEASSEAIFDAKIKIKDHVAFFEDTFEKVSLPTKYDNIILTHVLEHLDDPVAVLKRINDEWISDNGRLFLACPNANAPSRQIAVKMGLIDNNTSVTPAEKAHGHKITYTLDTLERDAKSAGLKVSYRSGIFFKALANFQWDRLLKTDIISKEYLEGCYQLGQQYPDLCSSIFLVCEKGTK